MDCAEGFNLRNEDDRLQLCVQSKVLFSHLAKDDFDGNADCALPHDI